MENNTDLTTTQTTDTAEQLKKWRLLLGSESESGFPAGSMGVMSAEEMLMDQALSQIYGWDKENGSAGGAGGRLAGQGGVRAAVGQPMRHGAGVGGARHGGARARNAVHPIRHDIAATRPWSGEALSGTPAVPLPAGGGRVEPLERAGGAVP